MIAYYDYEGNIELYLSVLNAIVGNRRDSFIDLACCHAPNTPMLRFKKRKYVDIIDRKLDHQYEQNFFVNEDILGIRTTPTSEWYDVSFCLDGIEHLSSEDGCKLLTIMEGISHKQILFTPLTDLFGMVKPDNKDPEAHRSLWSPEMTPDYASLVFPNYHKTSYNGGAYFFWKSNNVQNEFISVKQKLSDYGIYERNE